MDGKILNYSVLQHAETPGLGAKMQEWFRADKNKQSVLGRTIPDGGLKVTKMVATWTLSRQRPSPAVRSSMP